MKVGDTIETPAGWCTVLASDHGNSRSGEVPFLCRLSCVGEWGEPVLLLRQGPLLEVIAWVDVA